MLVLTYIFSCVFLDSFIFVSISNTVLSLTLFLESFNKLLDTYTATVYLDLFLTVDDHCHSLKALADSSTQNISVCIALFLFIIISKSEIHFCSVVPQQE